MDNSAQQLCQEREQRFADTIALKPVDRVPFELSLGYFPAIYSGLTCEATYYDYDGWLKACKKALSEFGVDITRVQPFFPGKIYELLGVKTMAWPGHGCSSLHSHQSIEIESMKADEYGVFMDDPTDFNLRYFLPRVTDILEPFSRLPALSPSGFNFRNILVLAEALSNPEIADTLAKLQQAGREYEKWKPFISKFSQELIDFGFPRYTSAQASAPFDVLSDNLRGMKGTMLDLYRQPDKLLEATDTILKRAVSKITPAVPGKNNRVGIPLHRGSAGFMSIKQFEKFYWPTLKALIEALVEKGWVPCVAFEGDYTARLEYLLELPKGKVLAHMDTTDIFKTKEVLGGHICFTGNIPISILQSGSVQDVADQVKKMVQACAKGGGFVMSTRSPLDDTRPDTLRALIDTTIKYGQY